MSRHAPQRGWDAVRSQIMAQMARCEPGRDEELLSTEDRRAFRVDDGEPYYGPTREAREAVNRILGLEASSGQGEWEAELATEAQIDKLIGALGDGSLGTEARSAIALLLLDHLDGLLANGTELVARIRWHLRSDARVQARMRYWWNHMEASGAVLEALS